MRDAAGGRVVRLRRRRDGDEFGAVATEFVLIFPLLVVMLFAIIDFGIFFSNALGVRQGVREAARSVVVLNPQVAQLPGGCGPFMSDPSATNEDLSGVNCVTQLATNALTGQAFSKAQLYDSAGLATDEWVVGNYLRVCGIVETEGLLGLTPMPNGGVVRSDVFMRIENGPGFVNGTSIPVPLAPAADPGTDWSFCD